ncbi:uncharacterized protein LOC126784209 [Argentina anserina]|uniref:uncharacterized protein LOC126784209 n=1 Tax=Argentina anserina TaxID=57926 RepID=UPI0021767E7F|nr:uncharacterized protein LOC126784209 [Potentilla anserina]
MAICESGPMMLNDVNCEGEYKDFNFISELLTESIKQVGYQNVVQVVTDNAPVCAKVGALIASKYHTIFWTPCVVHTLNLALKNICTPSHAANNVDVYAECSWIQPVVEDVMFIKNFIMNHGMRLVMFNDHCNLKLLSVAPTRFASAPIYEMIRKADTDKHCLHLVYEWWDNMMEQVKKAIYRKEMKQFNEESPFWDVVHKILLSQWSKATTPLHCLAHSLNPKYYSPEWLDEGFHRVAPHKGLDVTRERKNCFFRYFSNEDDRRKVNIEYAHFSMCMQEFGGGDVIKDRSILEPLTWWVVHGSSAPTLQAIAFKLLGQPSSSSSSCERNWSTYNFIHSLPRNKLAPQKAEDLVYVHTNLRLLARQSSFYNKGATHMWDIGGDAFDSLEDTNIGIFEVAELSLDEPELEAVLFDDGDDDEFEEELNAEDDVVS